MLNGWVLAKNKANNIYTADPWLQSNKSIVTFFEDFREGVLKKMVNTVWLSTWSKKNVQVNSFIVIQPSSSDLLTVKIY